MKTALSPFYSAFISAFLLSLMCANGLLAMQKQGQKRPPDASAGTDSSRIPKKTKTTALPPYQAPIVLTYQVPTVQSSTSSPIENDAANMAESTNNSANNYINSGAPANTIPQETAVNKQRQQQGQSHFRLENPAKNIRYFPCTAQDCQKWYSRISDLRNHFQIEHPGKSLPAAIRPRTSYTCEHCGTVFARRKALATHFGKVHKDQDHEVIGGSAADFGSPNDPYPNAADGQMMNDANQLDAAHNAASTNNSAATIMAAPAIAAPAGRKTINSQTGHGFREQAKPTKLPADPRFSIENLVNEGMDFNYNGPDNQ